MLDLMSQVWISAFGLAALLGMQSSRVVVRRWGVVLGLIGQPGWYLQLLLHEQWGMLPVFLGYTLVWIIGFWNLIGHPWVQGELSLSSPSGDEDEEGGSA